MRGGCWEREKSWTLGRELLRRVREDKTRDDKGRQGIEGKTREDMAPGYRYPGDFLAPQEPAALEPLTIRTNGLDGATRTLGT